MRSFFDDSGYEDEASHIFSRKKSRPKLRAFFSSASGASTVNKARTSSWDDCDIGQKISPDKDLPPTPPFTEHVTPSHPYHMQQDLDSGGDSEQYNSTSFFPSSNERDIFYRPSLVISTNCGSRNFQEEPEARPIRASNPSPRRAGRRLRSSPPPYPSPNSPLPPTPELSPVGLPMVSPPNSDHYHGEDRSIDSLESLAWRMPALQLQISKTSSDSSAALEVNTSRSFCEIYLASTIACARTTIKGFHSRTLWIGSTVAYTRFSARPSRYASSDTKSAKARLADVTPT